MKKWVKITIGVLSSAVILIAVAGFIFYSMLRSSLPDYSGTVKSFAVKNNIKIYRDSSAIPYIIAGNDQDAAFALGYVHAQERMFTMDIARRAGEGKLSEILGPGALPFDEMFITVGLYRNAKKNYSKLHPQSKRLLEAYAKGVNLYIKNKKGHYPVEFDVLDYDPDEWKPVDSYVIIRMMAWELNVSWWEDIAFTDLIQRLGEEKVKEIIPRYPENGPLIIPPGIKNYPKINNSFVQVDKAFRQFIGMGGTHIGSNNWVVNGSKSISGKPLIANDTHLEHSAPGKWFMAVIKAGDLDVAGFTLPGVPGVVIGKNKNISWVLTNVMEDDADFYIEKLDSTGTRYFFDNEWRKLQIIKDTIKVKDSSDVVLTIRSTHHGPIISGIHPYSFLYKDKEAAPISMHWLGNYFSDELFAIFNVNKAKNFGEFRSALKNYSVPGQNFVYGDIDGNIGYVFGARIPIRRASNGAFIYDGTSGKYDWNGFVPEDELPVMYNPPQNYIASANNKTDKNFKYYISNLWEPPSRIERITELLNSKNKHTVEDYKNYQMDFKSPYARKLTKFILDAFTSVKVTDPNLKSSLELFKNWNYVMDQYSQVPSIYAVFLNHLLENIFLDEMGRDLFEEFVFVANVPYRSVMQALENPQNSWFDNINTPRIETRDEIVRKSLDDALSELENKYGKDLSLWQWGRFHKVIFKHAFSGFSSIIDKYIDIGPYSIGGDGTTVFNTEYSFTKGIKEFPRFDHKPFENILGPAMRYIYDFSHPDEFYMILTTGESGNIISEHYDDMTQKWLTGKYLIIKTDEESIKRAPNKLLEIIKE